MSIFDLHACVVDDYRKYIRSFLSISDDKIREFVDTALLERTTL